MLPVSCIYSSSACNTSAAALDWGKNNILCYGSCNALQFVKYKEHSGGRHLLTAVGHKKLVTSVHWVSKEDGGPENEIITTSADHNAIIWLFKETECSASHILTGHKDIIRTSSSIYIKCKDNQCLLVATSSVDSCIKIWERCCGQVVCKQSLSLENGFALSVKLAELQNQKNELILIAGSTSTKINIYTQDEGMFIQQASVLGHEGWVQSIDIMNTESGDLFIASAAQDNYVKIWKIVPKLESFRKESTEKDVLNDTIDTNLRMDETVFLCKGITYSISLESVLSGHENWIYSVTWRPIKGSKYKSRELLSSSMDKTVILWEPDSASDIYLEKVRVGGVGGKGGTIGFFGSVFSPCGDLIASHGYQGVIHIWLKKEDDWIPGISFGGHYGVVKDIDWDPSGEFLLTCSSDQTTRLHSPFVNDTSENNWHEIARPQVHGYDMVCLSTLGRYKFVSAGDEKVLRVFEAPRNFAQTLVNLCKLDVASYLKDVLPEGASVPSLGLSNKAVFQKDLQNAASQTESNMKHGKDCYVDHYFTPTLSTVPPTEETLEQNTLWPEIQKLYGHPYEVFTVATNHSRTLVASACKASKAEHAAIILWNTSTWKQAGQLVFHNLTVTQLEFSPDDEFLLSVSRDRMWAIYRNFPEENPPYRKIANFDKESNVHTRIIWSCGWTFDSLYFVTTSRDKKVAMWGKSSLESNEPPFSLSCKPLEVEDSATAVSIAPCFAANNRYILAVGLESGVIVLSTWCKSENWNIFQRLDQTIAHHLTVNRLKFSPTIGEAGCKKKDPNVIQLASCSSDYYTKIFNINVNLVT